MRVRAGAAIVAAVAAVAVGACGSSTSATSSTTGNPRGATKPLPGTGKPPVTIGDKNFTEQFVLGELYAEALSARGYSVTLNRNIGPTEVTLQALRSGRLAMYPEYVGIWNAQIAGIHHTFRAPRAALLAARRYSAVHGFAMLDPTPFSDTSGIAVTGAYAVAHKLRTLGDLRKVAPTLTIGAPPQFQQTAPGLNALEQSYGLVPASFKPLAIGAQYQALQQGAVQAAVINTTDGQLQGRAYRLLADPHRVFGWGQAVPVLPTRVLAAEGPAFAATINRVSRLLTTAAIRRMNAAVDVYNQDPATVAHAFLRAHGIAVASGS